MSKKPWGYHLLTWRVFGVRSFYYAGLGSIGFIAKGLGFRKLYGQAVDKVRGQTFASCNVGA